MIIHESYRGLLMWTFGQPNAQGRDLSDYLPPAEHILLDAVVHYDESVLGKEITSAYEAFVGRVKRYARSLDQRPKPEDLQDAERQFVNALSAYGFEKTTTIYSLVNKIYLWGECAELEIPRKVDMTMGTYFDKKNALGYDFGLYLTQMECLALQNLMHDHDRVGVAFDRAAWQVLAGLTAPSLLDEEGRAKAEKQTQEAVDYFVNQLEYEELESDYVKIYVDALQSWARCETPKIQPEEEPVYEKENENDDVA